jgi:hypothetical protein
MATLHGLIRPHHSGYLDFASRAARYPQSMDIRAGLRLNDPKIDLNWLAFDCRQGSVDFFNLTNVAVTGFNYRDIRWLTLILDANDWDATQDDLYAMALGAIESDHGIRRLKIFIRGSTLFTRKDYIVLNDQQVITRNKSIVTALLKLRGICHVKVYGAMESSLRAEIMETCSSFGNSPNDLEMAARCNTTSPQSSSTEPGPVPHPTSTTSTALTEQHLQDLLAADRLWKKMVYLKLCRSEIKVIDVRQAHDLIPGPLKTAVEISGHATQPPLSDCYMEDLGESLDTRVREGYVGDRLIGWRVALDSEEMWTVDDGWSD